VGQAPEIAGGVGRGTGEALVVVGAEGGEHEVGMCEDGGLSETEFADQAVLTSAPGALDAALGLGRRVSLQLGADIILEHLQYPALGLAAGRAGRV
jgi:hypothetical protein